MLTTFPQCSFSLEFPEILSQNHMLSLTEYVWNFQNNASWDTHEHALLYEKLSTAVPACPKTNAFNLQMMYNQLIS